MKLSAHQSSKFVKAAYIGDSGTGKTGSLVSLVNAGYTLRILDLDNGLDSLRGQIEEQCPDKIDQVNFLTIRDPIKAGEKGPIIKAKAFVEATKYMTTWDDGTDPGEGGENEVFVLDTSTTLGKAAFEWAKAQQPGSKDPRHWYFAAQQAFENLIALLTGKQFHANVLVIGHITYSEYQDGTTKGYMSAVGSALGPKLAHYFNTLLLAESSPSGLGSNRTVNRTIRTIPTAVIDLKNPVPFKIDAEYPLNTGLATIFSKLKGNENA